MEESCIHSLPHCHSSIDSKKVKVNVLLLVMVMVCGYPLPVLVSCCFAVVAVVFLPGEPLSLIFTCTVLYAICDCWLQHRRPRFSLTHSLVVGGAVFLASAPVCARGSLINDALADAAASSSSASAA